jgi:hypothetical protein
VNSIHGRESTGTTMKDWLDIIKELTKKLTLSLTFAALMVLVGIFLREQIRRNGESM